MSKENAKEWVASNLLAASIYFHATRILALRAQKSGDAWRAVSLICRASQIIKIDSLNLKLVQMLKHCLNHFCRNSDGSLRSVGDNPILAGYLQTPIHEAWRDKVLSNPLDDAIRLRSYRENSAAHRQGNMMLLKRPVVETGEKGVVYLKYNESFFSFASVVDMHRIAKHYRIVLEPSNACAHSEFFLFVGSDLDVVMQCPYFGDHEMISNLGLNITPAAFGASDWVDETLFSMPPGDTEKHFDVAMIARWGPLKRHHVLFSALASLKPRRLKTVLVGYPLEWERTHIQALIDKAGLTDDIDIRQQLSPQEVADVLKDSRVSVSVSIHEGAVRALTESLFCNTPVIVNRANVGVNRDLIVEETGRFASDDELASTLSWVIDNADQFHARVWALENTGATITSAKLNEIVKGLATAANEPWTSDLAAKANRPNLEYIHDEDRLRLQDGYLELAELAGRIPGINKRP